MGRLAVAAAALAVIVAAVAVVDHRHKRQVEFAAQEDAWFCAHGRPSSCRDFDAVAYEARWERRELAYRVAFFAAGGAALAFGLLALRRRYAALGRWRADRRPEPRRPVEGLPSPVGAPRDQPPEPPAV